VAKKSKPKVKPSLQKRSLNAGSHEKSRGAPFSEQDPKRRLGDFTGTGEHPARAVEPQAS